MYVNVNTSKRKYYFVCAFDKKNTKVNSLVFHFFETQNLSLYSESSFSLSFETHFRVYYSNTFILKEKFNFLG